MVESQNLERRLSTIARIGEASYESDYLMRRFLNPRREEPSFRREVSWVLTWRRWRRAALGGHAVPFGSAVTTERLVARSRARGRARMRAILQDLETRLP
ncbi:hypothetical protein QBC40DRAFT_284644 [Triangularia verruculosa]|uniref:Uncharacterized protein n=1 Tax=Triangularia verruculosa TaxID=2587418 RepID=A0AAN6XEF9_9PEZI|nr:hypothetical protein QBC40DRAFT_284644 [Triangularia verruculosa]